MRYYYADPTNNPVGPYPLEDLHQLHVEGVINADTLVAEEDGASWFPYRALVVPAAQSGAGVEAPTLDPAYNPESPANPTPPAYAAAPAAASAPPSYSAPAATAAPAAAGPDMTPVGPHAVPQSDATLAMFLHLSSFLGIASAGAGMVVPILIWALNKDRSWFVNRHGIAFINMLISYIIWGLICGLLTLVLIGIPMLVALGLVLLVTNILAAVAANRGELYEYPLTIKFIK